MASGQVVRNTDTTMDWMYEGPAAQRELTAEEYLLGKTYKADGTVDVSGVDLRRGTRHVVLMLTTNIQYEF